MALDFLWTSIAAVVMGTTNISYYTIPLCWSFCLRPRLYANSAYWTGAGKLIDFSQPRSFAHSVRSDPALSSSDRGRFLRDRILRADAAVATTVESVPYFGVAILACNQVGVSYGWMNALSLAYSTTRLAYIEAYMYSDSLVLTALRIFFFFLGHGIVLTMFVLAGSVGNLSGR